MRWLPLSSTRASIFQVLKSFAKTSRPSRVATCSAGSCRILVPGQRMVKSASHLTILCACQSPMRSSPITTSTRRTRTGSQMAFGRYSRNATPTSRMRAWTLVSGKPSLATCTSETTDPFTRRLPSTATALSSGGFALTTSSAHTPNRLSRGSLWLIRFSGSCSRHLTSKTLKSNPIWSIGANCRCQCTKGSRGSIPRTSYGA